MFINGVTQKEGVNAGKRYRVLQVYPDRIITTKWDEDSDNESWPMGSFSIWHEPKTLFEDSSIEPTWGNLKKAMEAAGLPDDTVFVVPKTKWYLSGYGEPAAFSVEMLRQPYEKPKKHVVVR